MEINELKTKMRKCYNCINTADYCYYKAEAIIQTSLVNKEISYTQSLLLRDYNIELLRKNQKERCL